MFFVFLAVNVESGADIVNLLKKIAVNTLYPWAAGTTNST